MVAAHRRGDRVVLLALLDQANRGDRGIELRGNLDQPLAPQRVAVRNVAVEIAAVFADLQFGHADMITDMLLRLTAYLLMVSLPLVAAAQSYPSKPIRIVLGYS